MLRSAPINDSDAPSCRDINECPTEPQYNVDDKSWHTLFRYPWKESLGRCRFSITSESFTRLHRKPRLPVFRSSLLWRVDEAAEECTAGPPRHVGQCLWGHAEALAEFGAMEDRLPAFVA